MFQTQLGEITNKFLPKLESNLVNIDTTILKLIDLISQVFWMILEVLEEDPFSCCMLVLTTQLELIQLQNNGRSLQLLYKIVVTYHYLTLLIKDLLLVAWNKMPMSYECLLIVDGNASLRNPTRKT